MPTKAPKIKIDKDSLAIDFSERCFFVSESEEHFSRTIKGKIISYDYETNKEVCIGEITLNHINIGEARNAGRELFFVLDETQDVHDCFTGLWDDEVDDLDDDIIYKLAGDFTYINSVVIIEHLELKPKYRGNNLSTRIFQIVKYAHQSKALIILPKKGSKKLKEVYKKSGFKAIPKGHAMIYFTEFKGKLDINYDEDHISLDQLCRGHVKEKAKALAAA
jgi:hypothetical protein